MLADHHVEEALRVCTRAVLLLDGQVAAEAEPEEFREHPLVASRYLGAGNARFRRRSPDFRKHDVAAEATLKVRPMISEITLIFRKQG